MPGAPAARVGDMTAHGGTIAPPGCLTVLIGKKPAARAGDMQTCPMQDPMPPPAPPKPHVGGPILKGSATVIIGGQPAAVMGDLVSGAAAVGPITMGSPTVLIGGRPAARVTSMVSGVNPATGIPVPTTIAMGCPTVMIA